MHKYMGDGVSKLSLTHFKSQLAAPAEPALPQKSTEFFGAVEREYHRGIVDGRRAPSTAIASIGNEGNESRVAQGTTDICGACSRRGRSAGDASERATGDEGRERYVSTVNRQTFAQSSGGILGGTRGQEVEALET